jgi:hypothetical protein
MPCPLCGRCVTRSPYLHPTRGTIVGPDGCPWTCAPCGTTKKPPWLALGHADWCVPCDDQRLRRERRTCGDPGEGPVFKPYDIGGDAS